MTDILKNINHIYFTGIGGIGMSGIAEILLESGYHVSGSDRQLTDITEYLQAKGAIIFQGHQAEYLKEVDLLVYSSAIPANNPERIEARRLGIVEIRRAEMLAAIMEGHYKIAIAGTHGKTTTTALCSHVTIEAGLDPTVVIGGKLKNLKTNARLGKGNVFITEADEYDRSFLTLSPDISVITTIEEDHLDIYQDMNDIRETFMTFTRLGSLDGRIICCIDDPVVRDLSSNFKKEVFSYGFSKDAMYRASDAKFSENGSTFDILKNQESLARITLKIPGRHNILNALASYIVAEQIGIDSKNIRQALEEFTGVDRRFEIKGSVNKIIVVDDYAHHPTEITATIESARSGWNCRVVVVFQPHLYSRTRDFYKEFATALSKADEIILSEIYPAREQPISGVSSELILNEAKSQGYKNFNYIPLKETIDTYLLKNLRSGDMVITMGAGDIWHCGENLLKNIVISAN